MKALKKFISIFFAAVMLFSFAACNGEYNYAIGGIGGGGDKDSGSGPTHSAPTLDGDPTNDFTVTVTADGKPYSPRMEMYVYWSDGFSIYTAPLNKEGVARIDGLDGDYRVTLSAVPNEYTYDPNGNYATNDDRNIVLPLYKLNRLTGGGTGPYDCYNFKKTGVYSAVINSYDDGIFFQYAPEGSGTYSIESWADTMEDNINPYIDVYIGSSAWKQYAYTTDDGGAVGSYTINFVHTVQIADENISSGGQAVYTFAVKAESKNNKYPITITFAVKRDGDFELDYGNGNGSAKGMVVPELDFDAYNVAEHEYGNDYTMRYPEYKYEGLSNTYVFDERRFKLNEEDGFYHVYNKEAYPETEGYGPILYANVTSACRFIDRAFTQIEYDANGDTINSALSVNGKNYKHFFEGYTKLATYGNINGGSYYCSSACTCHDTSNPVGWACPNDCTNCHSECRRIPKELIGNEGYQSIVNSDGMAAVTEELREFLDGYCYKQTFFYDGKGTMENTLINGKYFQAVGESGWLFACAYYEKNV